LDCQSGFAISIQIQNIRIIYQEIKILKCIQATFYQNSSTINWSVRLWVDKSSWEFHGFIIKLLIFAVLYLFPKMVGLWFDLDWIVNPVWELDLDCQSHICDGFWLDWQSKKIGLSNSLILGNALRASSNLIFFL